MVEWKADDWVAVQIKRIPLGDNLYIAALERK